MDIGGLGYSCEVRQHMSRLPAINPNTRTLLLTGYPNVGKSSFMNIVPAQRSRAVYCLYRVSEDVEGVLGCARGVLGYSYRQFQSDAAVCGGASSALRGRRLAASQQDPPSRL